MFKRVCHDNYIHNLKLNAHFQCMLKTSIQDCSFAVVQIERWRCKTLTAMFTNAIFNFLVEIYTVSLDARIVILEGYGPG